MPIARKAQISLSDTCFYHCMSRCVRQGYLCGKDSRTGEDYSHRRGWVEGRLLHLAQVFAIDLCAYAVMSNHTHVVLHVKASEATQWSDEEVCRRWHRLHRGTVLTRQYMCSATRQQLSASERSTVEETIRQYRKRLYDISWFMRLLNEYIARKANAEEQRKGRFWEGRFKSQALLDEKAVLACMAYVDLNPVRAKLTFSPSDSRYTSFYRRLKLSGEQQMVNGLSAFLGQSAQANIPCTWDEYKQLIHFSAASTPIPTSTDDVPQLPDTLCLRFLPKQWDYLIHHFEHAFDYAAGSEHRLVIYKQRLGKVRIRGRKHAKMLFEI